MMNKFVLVSFPLAALLSAATLLLSEEPAGPNPPQLPPARAIPGITAQDLFPRGCVDCHINMPEMNQDERISTLLAEWSEQVSPELLALSQAVMPDGAELKGVHPKATSSLDNIPGDCFKCHDKLKKKAPPLAPLIHAIHFRDKEDNHFLTLFQGECTHCHKLDRKMGSWTVPSGPEASKEEDPGP